MSIEVVENFQKILSDFENREVTVEETVEFLSGLDSFLLEKDGLLLH